MVQQAEKEQKVKRKREVILNTALKIFAREGYADTDVQVIADLAGVGKGTVYRHFGNKQELFLATARQSQEMMGEFIRDQVNQENPAPQVLRDVALAYARYFELNPEAVEIMLHERATFRTQVFPTHLMYRAERRDEFEAYLQAAADCGQLCDINVSEFAIAFGDLLYGTIVNGCLEGSKVHLVQRVDRAFDIFLSGILPKQPETS